MKTYFIKDNYVHRLDNSYFDDTALTDKWQKEVYTFAKKIAEENKIENVLDIGTGSGYKLLENFKNFNTLGMDVEQTVEWLRKTYPDKNWTSKFEPVNGYDLIIASDVIEHIPDPDILLDLIQGSNPKFIVFSTPDRDLLNRTPDGPPKNRAHVREWTMPEFFNYINSRFDVIEHFISNKKQSTQVILAKVRT
jgi:2-polyprenyl-3-methyl-5-hydroxy-6-metoxy-1,4-benzoquinol methylase